MKHDDRKDDRVVGKNDIIDLGAASVETQGPVQPIELESFAFRLESGIAKD